MARTWLTVPVGWHTSRGSPSSHVDGLTDEEVAFIHSKWHNWSTADLDYAQPTVIFFCTGIMWLLILNVIFRLRSRFSSKSTSSPTGASINSSTSPSVLDRLTAICRYTVASQYRVRVFGWYSPPLAAIIGVGGMFSFVMALMLAVRPYYWPKHAMGHSMPIATRSGYISIGIMPFMIAFSTKVNWIALVTGTSHEKLQVFHRWSATFMYITSLVHTFPFIVMSIRAGEMELNWKTGTFYWTGVAALIPQTWLIFMSWGWIRNPYYETFKKLHITAAVAFMFFLFIHCNWILTSWDYFWATFAIYFLAFFTRIFRTLYNSALGLPASLEYLAMTSSTHETEDGLLKLTIQTPPRLRWTPGQHVFVRFITLGLHAFSSHPFTVASISPLRSGRDVAESDGHGKLELVFAVQGGITKKLAGLVKDKPAKALRVWVDGPYGGVPGKSLGEYESVYLLAGGSGVSFTLPILMGFVRQAQASKLKCRHIEFILAVRTSDSISWLEEQLTTARELGFTISVHVTRSPDDQAINRLGKDKNTTSNDGIEENDYTNNESIDDDKAMSMMKGPFGLSYGRPNLPARIHKACQTTNGSMAVAACGPDSFLYDVRNAVADCQLAIADGYGKCTDLFLHTENYRYVALVSLTASADQSIAAMANVGGSGLSSMTMILGREYYQTALGEPWLVLAPLAVHTLAGISRRAFLVFPKLLKISGSETKQNESSRRTWSPSLLSLSAYPLIFLLPIHFATHRALPMTPEPPINALGPAELDFNFVAHGLKQWPIRSWLIYGALTVFGAIHAVEGSKVLLRKWKAGSRREKPDVFPTQSKELPAPATTTGSSMDAGKQQTRIPTSLVASLIVLPVLSGLYFVSTEPTWVFSDTAKRFDAVYLMSWIYRF
ncbi:hypothetical protein D9758_001494 [Tetrapyrgos nigripes]|uniref:ferric-chelate reductase (NADPH) n=1 Tax=Tetrapyrgos nigripes TaxID=182062 RepID=A0A8H5GXK7_9AGAR|nr:hypothetical protein D9758_001494 [Tetrapyrgos nigripes]